MRHKTTGKTKRSSIHRFYLIFPRDNTDASCMVEKLLSLKPVQEVFLTDGDFGYLVKAKCPENGQSDAVDSMAKRIGGRYGKAVSYYQYRK